MPDQAPFSPEVRKLVDEARERCRVGRLRYLNGIAADFIHGYGGSHSLCEDCSAWLVQRAQEAERTRLVTAAREYWRDAAAPVTGMDVLEALERAAKAEDR